MRLLAASDLYGDLAAARALLDVAEAADVIVLAGDIGDEGRGASSILTLLGRAGRPIVLVAGNHDSPMALQGFCARNPKVHLLHGETLRLQGRDFFGLGGETPPVHAAPWNFAVTEQQADAMLAACPVGAALISHSPPHGFCDTKKDGRHYGAQALRRALTRQKPRLHLFGHVHDAFGQEAKHGKTRLRNLGPAANWFDL
ncbi:metallophosphoesterase [Sulfitobacter aestuarii]|uniref:Metallophosphoesterase n=1 Tax=Sulfitobacter aestuarii TaxID=2161676 RepID=A0ABW5U1E7_9RHOB